MIDKRDLEACAALAREVTRMRERLHALQSLAQLGRITGGIIGGNGAPLNDSTGEGASAITDLMARMQGRIDQYAACARRVESAIAGIDSPCQRDILRMRYIDGLTWEQIGTRTHYHERWCRALHQRAIAPFSRPAHTQPPTAG